MTGQEQEGNEPYIGSVKSMDTTPDMVHEFRTFLDTIIGYLEILKDEAEYNEEQGLAPELQKILLASNRMVALVEENSQAR